MKTQLPKYTSPAMKERARELRQAMTLSEAKLWQRLRNRKLHGLKFRRQCPIGPYIADFYCAQYQLVVEIDGGIHERQKATDQLRTQQFAEHGYQVIRFQNREVEEDIENVLDRIWRACQERTNTPLPASGEG